VVLGLSIEDFKTEQLWCLDFACNVPTTRLARGC